jgi:uncharacterized protein (TIGR03083 family)
MATSDPWPVIHAEREALARHLSSLTDAQWATPSLCGGWSVQQLLGHMTATATMKPASFFTKLAKAGFKFDDMAAREAASQSSGEPSETLARFKAAIRNTSHPPGPVDAIYGETLVHSTDIRRPLGLDHTFPAEALTRVGDFYRKSNLIVGGKGRAAGLTLRATDVDWTVGSGPEVSGPALSLILAITGRASALDDLSGDGVAAWKGGL